MSRRPRGGSLGSQIRPVTWRLQSLTEEGAVQWLLHGENSCGSERRGQLPALLRKGETSAGGRDRKFLQGLLQGLLQPKITAQLTMSWLISS